MTAVPQSAAAATPALRAFEAQWQARGAARPADALSRLREEAMRRVMKLGLPGTRDESWRYTNLRHVLRRGFVDAPPPRAAGAAPAAPGAAWSKLGLGATVTLVNGHPLPSALLEFNSKFIEINSLKDLSRVNPDFVANYLQAPTDAELGRWALLNSALFEDGLYVRVVGHAESPLIIRHVLSAPEPGHIAYPAIIIDAAPGSSATIIEHHVQQGAHAPLVNSATRIFAARNAQLEHYRIFETGSEAEHIDSLSIRQDADSQCRQFTIALGGGLVRASLESELGAAGAALDSYAMLVGHEARHVDFVNVVTHGAPDTRSRQTARAIASGTSRAVFNTKVVVSAGAQRAASSQSSRGLLLSPTAEIDTRPQLEIHADEVKCAHGATTGRLDPDMLFYLLSRGIDRETAQSLLVYAFLDDVLTDMSVPAARTAIEEALVAQLPDSNVVNEFR